jgi:hypothetical protein
MRCEGIETSGFARRIEAAREADFRQHTAMDAQSCAALITERHAVFPAVRGAAIPQVQQIVQ